ncbi:NAD(P)/FAD-dependent oxidoreductase, partial [Pyrobaculum aerophilum]
MKRVVIVGGGVAGITVAKTLLEGKMLAEITVVNNTPHYFSGPSRPLIITQEQSLDRIVRSYEEVARRGIKVVVGTVYSIDPANRVVKLVGGYTSDGGLKELKYDYLVLAPGIVLDGSQITGYEKYRGNVLNVYDPGRVHALREKVWKAERGTV